MFEMTEQSVLGIAGLNAGGVGIYGLLALVLVTLIKTWPLLNKMSIDARAAMRGEKRTDDLTCQQRIDAMSQRIDAIAAQAQANEAKAHALEMKVTLQNAAYRLVVSELHRINPKSAVIAQAQALLAPDLMATLPVIDPDGAAA